MVVDNRKVTKHTSRRVGSLQKQHVDSKNLMVQLRQATRDISDSIHLFERRLSGSEENIQTVANSLQHFRQAYVDRLRQQEHNEKIKRVCGIVASVAGFVFAPVLKEVAGAVVDFVNPIEIVEKVYGEVDIARFVSEGTDKVLPKVIQEQLEKYAIPKDEFETLLREEIVLQHPEYVDECKKRCLSLNVDGGQSDIARSVEPLLDKEEILLTELVGELHITLNEAILTKASAPILSMPPPRVNVVSPVSTATSMHMMLPSSPLQSPSCRLPPSPTQRQKVVNHAFMAPRSPTHSLSELCKGPKSADQVSMMPSSNTNNQSVELASSFSTSHASTISEDEPTVVFVDDLEAFHYHMAVYECRGDLTQLMELLDMVDRSTCDPIATVAMKICEETTSQEVLCAAEIAYRRGFHEIGDLLASRMINPPVYDKTPATSVQVIGDLETVPFIHAVEESQGDVEECEAFWSSWMTKNILWMRP